MSKTKDTLRSDVISRGVSDGPTAEATARYISEHAWISRGRVVLEMGDRKKDALDWKAAHLMADLFYDARCGWAGAEYNLEKAGMIEMLFLATSPVMWMMAIVSGPTSGGRLQTVAGAPAWPSWSASSCEIRRLRSHYGMSRTRPTTSPATVLTASPATQPW